jgi:hypothetical protein
MFWGHIYSERIHLRNHSGKWNFIQLLTTKVRFLFQTYRTKSNTCRSAWSSEKYFYFYGLRNALSCILGKVWVNVEIFGHLALFLPQDLKYCFIIGSGSWLSLRNLLTFPTGFSRCYSDQQMHDLGAVCSSSILSSLLGSINHILQRKHIKYSIKLLIEYRP